jgi:hypothetical protein
MSGGGDIKDDGTAHEERSTRPQKEADTHVSDEAPNPLSSSPLAARSSISALGVAETLVNTKRSTEIDINLLSNNYSALEKLANEGSVAAARALYRGTSACEKVPDTNENLQSLLKRLIPSAPLTDNDREKIKYLTSQFNRCSPLTYDQRSSSTKWLETAARLGDADAQLDFLSRPPAEGDSDYWLNLEKYQETSESYLSSGLKSKDPTALLAISNAYSQKGRIRGAPDRVLQLAYMSAYFKALGEHSKDSELLIQLGMNLTPLELHQAEEISETIYNGWRSNK